MSNGQAAAWRRGTAFARLLTHYGQCKGLPPVMRPRRRVIVARAGGRVNDLRGQEVNLAAGTGAIRTPGTRAVPLPRPLSVPWFLSTAGRRRRQGASP